MTINICCNTNCVNKRGVFMTRKEAADRYYQLRQEKESLTESLKSVQESLDQVEAQLVLLMENESLSSFKDDDIGTVSLREEVRASIESEEQLFNWLKENNLDSCVKQTIHSKTLAAMAKDYPSMPGIKTYYQTKISLRKGK